MPSVTTTTGFLSLSPELRNNIYDFAIRHDRAIEIRPASHEFNRRFDGFSHDALSVHVGSYISPALLRTSKLIYHEASAILYGENEFFVAAAHQLGLWLDHIGDSVRLLRRIAFRPWAGNDAMVSCLEKLARATSLTRLTLYGFRSSGRSKSWLFGSAPTLAATLMPLMLSLKMDRAGTSDEQLVEVVSVDLIARDEETRASWTRELRQELLRLLGSAHG